MESKKGSASRLFDLIGNKGFFVEDFGPFSIFVYNIRTIIEKHFIIRYSIIKLLLSSFRRINGDYITVSNHLVAQRNRIHHWCARINRIRFFTKFESLSLTSDNWIMKAHCCPKRPRKFIQSPFVYLMAWDLDYVSSRIESSLIDVGICYNLFH